MIPFDLSQHIGVDYTVRSQWAGPGSIVMACPRSLVPNAPSTYPPTENQRQPTPIPKITGDVPEPAGGLRAGASRRERGDPGLRHLPGKGIGLSGVWGHMCGGRGSSGAVVCVWLMCVHGGAYVCGCGVRIPRTHTAGVCTWWNHINSPACLFIYSSHNPRQAFYVIRGKGVSKSAEHGLEVAFDQGKCSGVLVLVYVMVMVGRGWLDGGR